MQPEPRPEQLIGQYVGNYRVASLIGSGGMAQVYAAEHPTLGKLAAVKVLDKAIANEPELVARFRNEAVAVARLNHPNIVEVHDFGALSDGRPFYIMEYLRGMTLTAYMQHHQQLSVAVVVAILEPLCAALETAHAAGIVHRDIKPDNIFLHVRGDQFVPKLLDFGIAKLVTQAVGVSTLQGGILGTPQYMAPEQCMGRSDLIGPAADLYALGIVAYQLLTGMLPFPASHLGELIHAHLTMTPPDLRSLRGDVPGVLAEVIGTALVKDPTVRLQSATAFREALRRFPADPLLVNPLLTAPGAMAVGTPHHGIVGETHRDSVDMQGETVDADSKQIGRPAVRERNMSAPPPDSASYQVAPPTRGALLSTSQRAPSVGPPSGHLRQLQVGNTEDMTPAPYAPAPMSQPGQVGLPGQVVPAPATNQRLLWGLAGVAALCAATAIGVLVHRSTTGQAPAVAAPPPPINAATPPPTPVAVVAVATSPDAALAPEADPPQPIEPSPSPVATPAITSKPPRVKPPLATQVPVTATAAKTPAIPAAPPTQPVAVNDWKLDEQTQREITDALIGSDHKRVISIANRILASSPGNQMAVTYAGTAACQLKDEKLAQRFYALHKTDQGRHAMEISCVSIGEIYLSEASKNSPIAKQTRARNLYSQASHSVATDGWAQAAKLYEQAFREAPDFKQLPAARYAAQAACRVDDEQLVARMWPHLSDDEKKHVAETCIENGVALPEQ